MIDAPESMATAQMQRRARELLLEGLEELLRRRVPQEKRLADVISAGLAARLGRR